MAAIIKWTKSIGISLIYLFKQWFKFVKISFSVFWNHNIDFYNEISFERWILHLESLTFNYKLLAWLSDCISLHF